ncbi:unnamed protein product [Gemmataceae bacterium]|nr:unnamed protein product [Gemmataceae bacterium]VTU00830.1 unnamed protein product [Gemmataceae bacterium]
MCAVPVQLTIQQARPPRAGGRTVNANEHYRNRLDSPQDKLARHAGKFVAWSGDGTDTLASADAIDDLVDAVDARHPIIPLASPCVSPHVPFGVP